MYSLFLIAILFIVCGSHSLQNKQITNGKVADLENFPYQASLALDGLHICGGAIISHYYVLTAAHCFKFDDKERYQVRVGSHRHDRGGVVYKVKNFVKNNLYEILLSEKKLFDVAVILVNHIDFNKFVRPIALPLKTDKTPYTLMGTIAGWGAVVEKGGRSDFLRFANVQIWKQTDCIEVFGPRKIKNEVFCAGHHGKDSCTGDSGGPFVYNGKVIGIVSYGIGCGRPRKPGVYTNVITNLEWIKKTIDYLDLDRRHFP